MLQCFAASPHIAHAHQQRVYAPPQSQCTCIHICAGTCACTCACTCRIHALFGRNASKALPLVATARITCLRGAPSGRELYKVEASGKGEEYRVLPWQYCECPAFAALLWRGDGACVRAAVLRQLRACMHVEMPCEMHAGTCATVVGVWLPGLAC